MGLHFIEARILTADTDVFRDFPRLLSPEEAARLIHEAADVHATGVSAFFSSAGEPAGMLMQFDAGITPIRMVHTSAGIRMSERDYQVLANLKRRRRAHQLRNLDKRGASLEVLRRNRLPLYWNHGWRQEKYRETGSFNVLAERYAREVQGAQGTSIATFDQNYFNQWRERGERRTPQWRRNRRDEFAEYYARHHLQFTQAHMARHFRVTDSTISRWIRELSSIYREAAARRPDLVEDDGLLEEFAVHHRVDPRIVRNWLLERSPVFAMSLASQPKERYYSRGEYRQLFQRFEALYREADGKIHQRRTAEALGVDRSTVRQWVQRIREADSQTDELLP